MQEIQQKYSEQLMYSYIVAKSISMNYAKENERELQKERKISFRWFSSFFLFVVFAVFVCMQTSFIWLLLKSVNIREEKFDDRLCISLSFIRPFVSIRSRHNKLHNNKSKSCSRCLCLMLHIAYRMRSHAILEIFINVLKAFEAFSYEHKSCFTSI